MGRRNRLDEIANLGVLERFNTGDDPVNITLYKRSDGSVVPLTSDVCTEIGTTGVFTWDYSNITTPPTVLTEYFYEMRSASDMRSDSETFGGWVEDVGAGATVPDPDLCIITGDVSQPAGCLAEAEQFNSMSTESYAEIPATYCQLSSGRFITLDKTFPDIEAGTITFTLPRLASAKLVIPALGIDETILVPDTATANLKDLLA